MTSPSTTEKLPARHGGASHDPKTYAEAYSYFPPLPPVDWAKIGKTAPTFVSQNNWDASSSALPEVDYVMMVDTAAEWSAFDQVFLNPGKERKYYDDYDWKNQWVYYGKGWPSIEHVLPPDAPSRTHKAWGSIAQVSMGAKRVLLVKTDMHISTDGPTIPLMNFIQQILDEAKPKLFLTSGTAGGAKTDMPLGDVSVTNSAKFDLDGEFSHLSFKNAEYKNAWTPAANFATQVTPILNAVPATDDYFKALLDKLNKKVPYPYTLDQVMNNLLWPSKLHDPKIIFYPDSPVLTTNSYVVATTDGNFEQYAAMEMDDAAIAKVCDANGTAFGCVRNISDPAVNASLGQNDGSDWASLIYSTFGFYSTFNGSLAGWSIIDLD